MARNDEEYYEEEQQQQEEALPPGEPETFQEKFVRATPWWGISISLHILLFLILGTIAAFKAQEKKEEIIVASIPNIPPEPIVEVKIQDNQKKEVNLENRVEDPVNIKLPESDHTETPDEDFEKTAKGESLDNTTLHAFKGRGANDSIGSGGGAAGRYGTRRGGQQELAKRGGGGTDTIVAVTEALKWLARHQNADGSWSTTQFEKNCGRYGYKGQCTPNEFKGKDEFDVGNTGLALLAFLGAGYTPASKKQIFPGHALTYGDVVKRALKYLISIQDASGRIGPECEKYMYNHTIAALALTEAYGMTNLAMLRNPAQKAVEFTVKAKNPGFGWRYAYQSGDTDSSVTGWAIMVLKSAEIAEISFERSVYEDVKKWYDDVSKEVDYNSIELKPPASAGTSVGNLMLTGYKSSGDAGRLVALRGVNEHYYYNPALTAIMIMSTVFIEKKPIAKASKAIDSILSFLPQKWSPEDRNSWKLADFYYWYYASYALFQVTSEKDGRWTRWNNAMKTALLETQNLKGFEGQCKCGSWEPVDRWACEGGRVYTTAMGALTLEVYYRYGKILPKR